MGEKNNNYTIEILKEINKNDWNILIEKSEHSTIFHTIEWKNVIEKTYKNISSLYIVVFNSKGEISGGLQLFKRRLIPGIYFLETPPWGNPLLLDENNNTIRYLILKRLKKLGKNLNFVRIILNDYSNTCCDLNNLGYKYEKFFSYILELEKSYSWLWKNKFHNNTKRYVDRAQKQNNFYFEKVSNISQVEQFYQFSRDTELRLNNTVFNPFNLYKNIFYILNKKNMLYWNLAKIDDVLVGGSLNLNHKDTMFVYLTATYKKYFQYEVNRILINKNIIWGFDNNYKVYNFGGNPNNATGVSLFKESWGCKRKNYYIYFKNKIIYKPIKTLNTIQNSIGKTRKIE